MAPKTSLPDTRELTARELELLRAAADVFDERGYERLTVDEVAARAHASKATIYRRWPSKPKLVAAALSLRFDSTPFDTVPTGDSLREGLLGQIQALAREAVARRATISSLVGDAARHPELSQELRVSFVDRRRSAMQTVVDAHADELREGADAYLVASLGPAAIYFRILISDEPIDDDFAAEMVDTVILPLLT